ncbi:TetR family transcriptional regulator [Frankia canadensis]|uniref:TetR family transcriptional regulator n=1 Tax=Frankia canadensis TaxID=1836972 RepID=A0A2I2KK78_9ACTN|nr:helix-turn-helix domain-containing protein [Frankia canadensis]SNQ46070.1 TetR family transcriptional regulator [Frankia canadensis]SOU53360.1 TetR family transcriptional regulator [Frankia canadensis]
MTGLTPKGAATRARIVEGASAVIRDLGVAAATLDDIRAHTRTSKSQLFHYFPGGREELLLAVARFEAETVLRDQQPQLGNLTTWDGWTAWRDTVVERYRRQGRRCPLHVLTAHLGATSPGSQAVVTELMQHWQAEIATGVRHLHDAGEIDPRLDADTVAAAILAGIQGGVVIQMSTGSTRHLEAALDSALDHLRTSRLGASQLGASRSR